MTLSTLYGIKEAIVSDNVGGSSQMQSHHRSFSHRHIVCSALFDVHRVTFHKDALMKRGVKM